MYRGCFFWQVYASATPDELILQQPEMYDSPVLKVHKLSRDLKGEVVAMGAYSLLPPGLS